jgi:hypothetical protein
MASAAGQKRGAAEMAAGGSEDEAPWSTSFTVQCFGQMHGMQGPDACITQAAMHILHTQMLRLRHHVRHACVPPCVCSCMHAD